MPRRSCSERSRFRICACTETSSALVGSSQTISFGLDRQRAGDGDALALPARELVRVARSSDSGGRPTSLKQLRSWTDLSASFAADLQAAHALEQDLRHPHPRIERRVGVLEDDLHRAANRPQLARCCVQRSVPLETQRAPAVGAMSCSSALPSGGLAAARLADDARACARRAARATRRRPPSRSRRCGWKMPAADRESGPCRSFDLEQQRTSGLQNQQRAPVADASAMRRGRIRLRAGGSGRAAR